MLLLLIVLYNAILRSWADSLRSRVILHNRKASKLCFCVWGWGAGVGGWVRRVEGGRRRRGARVFRVARRAWWDREVGGGEMRWEGWGGGGHVTDCIYSFASHYDTAVVYKPTLVMKGRKRVEDPRCPDCLRDVPWRRLSKGLFAVAANDNGKKDSP